MSSTPSTKKRTELFHTLMEDISRYLGSTHNSEANKLLQRVEHIQHKVKETEKARAATVAAAEVAVQAAAAAQRAADEAAELLDLFEPPRPNTHVSKPMSKRNIKKMKGKRSATRTPHSSPVSLGGRRTIRKRR